MKLEHEFNYYAMLKEPVAIGAGPYGTRMFFEVIDGRCEGDRVKADVLTGGGDWLLVGPDGWGRLDVRAQCKTDDGAMIYIAYFGILEVNEKVQKAMADDSETDWGDQYFRTNPRFETGDPRYTWLNQGLFVAEGRIRAGRGVEYRVYRAT